MRTVSGGIAHVPVLADPTPRLEDFGFEHLSAELGEELHRAIMGSPAWRLARVAFVVTADGVETIAREELAAHYRRHGLRPLARLVTRAPVDRALLLLDGEPEVRAFALDPSQLAEMEGAC